METSTLNAIVGIFTPILVALAGYGAKKLIDYIEVKTLLEKNYLWENEEDNIRYKINDIVTTAVKSVTQTYVDNLKKINDGGRLTSDEMKKAMDMTIREIRLLAEHNLKDIECNLPGNDILRTLIEKVIYDIKRSK